MKRSILRILICPACGGGLVLKNFSKSSKNRPENEVMEGTLGCKKCNTFYPIINGIPRMVPPSMINQKTWRDFLEKHGEKTPAVSGKEVGEKGERLKKKTSESFGFQWNVFPKIRPEHEKNFLNYIEPIKPGFFRGKLVLDAGCGFGRHTYYAAKYGAEVIGFDLSDAVEAAYKNCGKMKGVHIVQADIYNLPFREKFDFIMSIGVLHHLPDPKLGFMKLVDLMKRNTEIFIWLYGREGRWFKIHVVEGIIRRVTTRMPHRMLYYFCYIPASIYQFFNLIYNSLNARGLSGIAKHLPFKRWAKFAFKSKHADAFDLLATPVNNYYRREEVKQWADEARLKNPRITSLEGKSWSLFGSK
jgi:SAM-dependent methyltransferase